MRHDLGRLHGRAAWITVSLILLVFLTRLPRSVNLFIAILIIGGWSMWGVRWLVARFGRKVLLVLSIVVFIVAGLIGYLYWKDAPNRRLYFDIKALGGRPMIDSGDIIVGPIEYVYFDSSVTDAQVQKFAQLQGLDGLKRLVFKETRITDDTAILLTRLTHLESLYIENSLISQELADQLVEKLPHCSIEIK